MSNVQNTATVHHPVSTAIPESATRKEWQDVARKLRNVAMTHGLAADTDKQSAFIAIAAASYALLIASTIDGDNSILESTEKLFAAIPGALDKKAQYKGRYALKIAALRAAKNAAENQRKNLAACNEIDATTMLESITLHEEIKALTPVAKTVKTIKAPETKASSSAPEKAVTTTNKVPALSDAAIRAAVAACNPCIDQVAGDAGIAYQDGVEDRALALAAMREAEAEADAKREADKAEREAELMAQLMAQGESIHRKAVAFCNLATEFGIKLTKAQLATLDAAERKVA